MEQHCPAVGQAPVGLEVAHRAVGKDGQHEVRQAGEDKKGEGDSQQAVEDAEKFSVIRKETGVTITWEKNSWHKKWIYRDFDFHVKQVT